MDKFELAAKLDGVGFNSMENLELFNEAKQNGLVVVYGASDDLFELRGAIDDEGDVYGGGRVYLTPSGIFRQDDCGGNYTDCPFFLEHAKKYRSILAVWCAPNKGGAAWSYETDIPHAEFRVFENGDLYCLGIVFDAKELLRF